MKTNARLAWLACLMSLLAAVSWGAEEIAIVKDARVNVRGQPSLVGEVITQLQKGEKVVVLEEVTVAKPKTNEPPKWARIQMPTNTPVWVFASFIDPTNKSVRVSRLNLRAGPGENYSVIGRLQKGAAVSEIRRVEAWMEIETPPGAFAFVAADLLTKPEFASAPIPAQQEPAKAVPAVPLPVTQEPPPSQPPSQPAQSVNPLAAARQTVVAGEQTPAQAPPDLPVKPAQETKPAVEPNVAPPPAVSNETVAPPAAKPVPPEEAKIRRIVRREGIVRSTVSIQAPTYYELLSPENRKTINYLHTEKLDVDLDKYRGRRIIVTGEEAVDSHWPRTPVIEVETLELIP